MRDADEESNGPKGRDAHFEFLYLYLVTGIGYGKEGANEGEEWLAHKVLIFQLTLSVLIYIHRYIHTFPPACSTCTHLGHTPQAVLEHPIFSHGTEHLNIKMPSTWVSLLEVGGVKYKPRSDVHAQGLALGNWYFERPIRRLGGGTCVFEPRGESAGGSWIGRKLVKCNARMGCDVM